MQNRVQKPVHVHVHGHVLIFVPSMYTPCTCHVQSSGTKSSTWQCTCLGYPKHVLSCTLYLHFGTFRVHVSVHNMYVVCTRYVHGKVHVAVHSMYMPCTTLGYKVWCMSMYMSGVPKTCTFKYLLSTFFVHFVCMWWYIHGRIFCPFVFEESCLERAELPGPSHFSC